MMGRRANTTHDHLIIEIFHGTVPTHVTFLSTKSANGRIAIWPTTLTIGSAHTVKGRKRRKITLNRNDIRYTGKNGIAIRMLSWSKSRAKASLINAVSMHGSIAVSICHTSPATPTTTINNRG